MKASLSIRFVVWVLGTTLPVLTCFYVYSWWMAAGAVDDMVGRKLAMSATTLSAGWSEGDVARAFFDVSMNEESPSGVPPRVARELVSVARSTESARLLVLDRSGAVIARSDELSTLKGQPSASPERVPPPPIFGDRLLMERALTQGSSYSRGFTNEVASQRVKQAYAPVFFDGVPVAFVVVEAGKQGLRVMEEVRDRMIRLAFAWGAIFLGVGLFGARRVVRPLEQLIRSAERIGEGDLRTPVQVSGQGELEMLGGTVETMRLSLLARDEEQRMMLGGVAHEVRNPLGAIELFLGLLREDVSAEQRSVVERVLRQTEHLRLIVDRYLEWSSPVVLHLERLDVQELSDWVQDASAAQAEEYGVEVVASVEVSEVVADRTLVRAAVLNLVLNAIQASPHGGEVALKWRENEMFFCVCVEDAGPGLETEEQRDAAMRPFFTSKQTGSGLGLPMVRRVAVAHGGDITFGTSSQGGLRAELSWRRRGASMNLG